MIINLSLFIDDIFKKMNPNVYPFELLPPLHPIPTFWPKFWCFKFCEMIPISLGTKLT